MAAWSFVNALVSHENNLHIVFADNMWIVTTPIFITILFFYKACIEVPHLSMNDIWQETFIY